MDRVPATQAMRARGGRPTCWRSLRIDQFWRLGLIRFEGLANQSNIGFALPVVGQSKSSRVVNPKRALIAFRWSGYRLGLAPPWRTRRLFTAHSKSDHLPCQRSHVDSLVRVSQAIYGAVFEFCSTPPFTSAAMNALATLQAQKTPQLSGVGCFLSFAGNR